MTARKMSATEKAYHELRSRSISYEFRPGERINEVLIAKLLGVSRTPLREALNRLESEGFLTFSPNQGFFRRKLELSEISELIEFRAILERGGSSLAAQRASDEQLAELRAFAESVAAEIADLSVENRVARDEEFHERLMDITGNREMLKRLRVLNGRLRFMRWGDQQRDGATPIVDEHRSILAALETRDGTKAAQIVGDQIERSRDDIVEAVKHGYALIFMRGENFG